MHGAAVLMDVTEPVDDRDLGGAVAAQQPEPPQRSFQVERPGGDPVHRGPQAAFPAAGVQVLDIHVITEVGGVVVLPDDGGGGAGDRVWPEKMLGERRRFGEPCRDVCA